MHVCEICKKEIKPIELGTETAHAICVDKEFTIIRKEVNESIQKEKEGK